MSGDAFKRALDDLDKARATIARVAEVYRTTAVSEDEATACELQERLGDALGEAAWDVPALREPGDDAPEVP